MLSNDVKEFYDGFLKSRMVSYRIYGSGRLRAAIGLVTPHVRPGAYVADIGCGIGIVAEAVAKCQPSARVYGVDISPANIEYAKRTVKGANVTFLAASVTEQFDELKRIARKTFDIVTLIDVIEHIPEQNRKTLFKDLAELSSPTAKLILAYPSSQYLAYLAKEQSSEIQIIDNQITPAALADEAGLSGWHLTYLKYVLENKYIHLVFSRNLALEEEPEMALLQKIHTKLRMIFVVPYLRKKYDVEAFRDWPT